MPEQNLDDADVHASLKHVRGKAVAERVRSKVLIEAALVPRLHERVPHARVGHVGHHALTGEEPLLAAMDLPNLAEHLEDRLGQRENPLLVALSDDAEHHLLRVDRRNGQRDGFGNPQAVGVDERETAAIDGLLERGDQAAAVGVAADVGQAFLPRLADFFFVNSSQL